MGKLSFSILDNLIANVKKLDSDKILKKIIVDPQMQNDILDLNFQGQLYNEGVDALGNFLGNYSPLSVEMKLEGDGDHRIDHITLKDTGEFYDSGKIKNGATEFSITADTEKPDGDLTERFGKNIIGLNEKSISIFIPKILPIMRDSVLAQIQK